jgi:hypothetical protein
MTSRPLLARALLLLALLVPLGACGNDDAPGSAGAPSGSPGAPVPEGWRTEVWHDASVRVPADWGWGAAPLRIGNDVVTCGDGPAGGSAYVGRPFMLSDLCVGLSPDGHPPTAPSVWLGAAVEPGTEELGGGWVRETVAQGGTTVTVTSDDPALREQVLGSVGGPLDCAPVLHRPSHPDSIVTEGYGDPVSLDVCLYRSLRDDDPLELVYGTTLGQGAARAFADALALAPRAEPDCGRDLPFEWATLHLTGEPRGEDDLGGGTQEMSIGCGVVESSPGEYHALDEQVLDALRVQGLPSTMSALIGMLG